MENLSNRQFKSVYSKIGIILILTYIVNLFSTVFIRVGLELFFENIENTTWYLWLIVFLSNFVITFPTYILLMKLIPDNKLEHGEKQKKAYTIKEIIVLLVICLSATYLASIVTQMFNLIIMSITKQPISNNLNDIIMSSDIVFTFIMTCILAPIIEEIMFRKIMLNKLSLFGEHSAATISALTFALYHANFQQFLYAFLLGLIFSYITIKSGTILYAIILHAMVNFTGSILVPQIALSNNQSLTVALGLGIIFVIILGIILFFKLLPSLFPKMEMEFSKLESEDNSYYFRPIVKPFTALTAEGIIIYLIFSIGLIILSI